MWVQERANHKLNDWFRDNSRNLVQDLLQSKKNLNVRDTYVTSILR